MLPLPLLLLLLLLGRPGCCCRLGCSPHALGLAPFLLGLPPVLVLVLTAFCRSLHRVLAAQNTHADNPDRAVVVVVVVVVVTVTVIVIVVARLAVVLARAGCGWAVPVSTVSIVGTVGTVGDGPHVVEVVLGVLERLLGDLGVLGHSRTLGFFFLCVSNRSFFLTSPPFFLRACV